MCVGNGYYGKKPDICQFTFLNQQELWVGKLKATTSPPPILPILGTPVRILTPKYSQSVVRVLPTTPNVLNVDRSICVYVFIHTNVLISPGVNM